MNDKDTKVYLNALQNQVLDVHNTAQAMMIGKQVKILSDFNGQPYGRSKKSLKGKTFFVISVEIDRFQIWLFLKDMRCGIDSKEVEFID
ncbi:hypothetical protein LCGC14_2738380 [marine sediment metagenome]|uniref:Uncharacterized protein n=1 Tax=marine sediment metagenome TaxID=412755 RepID=A0A0F8Z571_9ZZZZ